MYVSVTVNYFRITILREIVVAILKFSHSRWHGILYFSANVSWCWQIFTEIVACAGVALQMIEVYRAQGSVSSFFSSGTPTIRAKAVRILIIIFWHASEDPNRIYIPQCNDLSPPTFVLELIYIYTGCSLTHATNFDSLYKNPKITLFQE